MFFSSTNSENKRAKQVLPRKGGGVGEQYIYMRVDVKIIK
jgi:hypothetical protein